MNATTINIVRGETVTTVEDFCVLTVSIDTHLIDEIASRVPDVDEDSVATLLFTIDKCRILSIVEGCEFLPDYRKISDHDLLHNITKILQRYDIDNLIEICEELKYFQIRDILEDNDNPIKTLRKYL